MITKRIVSNYINILKGKLYFFIKKSIWKYILATLLITSVSPIDSLSILTSFTLYFLGLMIIIIPLILISAKIQANKTSFDAYLTFNDKNIIVHHRNKELIETKKWSWIKKIDNKRDTFYLIVNQKTPFAILIQKNKLTAEQICFLNYF